jgi:hypothetical protein
MPRQPKINTFSLTAKLRLSIALLPASMFDSWFSLTAKLRLSMAD